MDLFPKAPHGKIAWVEFALGFDHFYDCSHTPKICPRGEKNLKDLFRDKNVVVNIEGWHKSLTVSTVFTLLIKPPRQLSLTRATQSLIILRLKSQAPVVRKADSAVHWINNYPVDSAIGFPNTYPMDSDLPDGYSAIYLLNNRGLDFNFVRAQKKSQF